MKYGFVLSYGTPSEIVELAREAEFLGWDGVFTWDGVSLGPMPTYDPWSVMSAIAMRTKRVTIGAMILPLARRKPWEVVKQAVTIDHLSEGRLVLPVGLGVPDDRAFSGVNTDSPDRKDRAERLDECLEILELGQRGEPFSFNGTHYRVEDMTLVPTPVQPRIPVWAVAAWPHEKSMARAARWDGIIPADHSPGVSRTAPISPDTVWEITQWMREHRDTGAPFDVVVEGKTADRFDHGYVRALAEAGATWFIESRWEEDESPESLMARIRNGPPRI